jgi:hypothetical protein
MDHKLQMKSLNYKDLQICKGITIWICSNSTPKSINTNNNILEDQNNQIAFIC